MIQCEMWNGIFLLTCYNTIYFDIKIENLYVTSNNILSYINHISNLS